jgi:hypothetical protein
VEWVAGASTIRRTAVRRDSAASSSVIIPATDDPDTLDRCLAAIERAVHPPDEVIVVDGPSGDGPAAARNAGVVRASGGILIFVDADVEVHDDAFARIHAAFARDSDLVAIFGSYDAAPSAHGVVSTFRNLLHHYVHQSADRDATTFWAGLGAVRRDAFVAVDGFDEVRFKDPSVEDIELGLRLAAAGGCIKLDPDIQGTHLKRWGLRSMVTTDVCRRGTPWTALVLDHGASAARLNLRGRPLAAAALFTASIGALLLGRPRLAAPLASGYLILNARFYRLALRSGGVRDAVAGVALLAVHNAAALASIPLGVVSFGKHRLRRRRPPQTAAVRPETPSGDVLPLRASRRFARRDREAIEAVPGPPSRAAV